MTIIDNLVQGFFLLLRWDTYAYISAGLAIGMFVGAMPGLTTILAMSVLLPISFKIEPLLGIPFLIGLYKGGIYGGSIPAILVGIPGTGASIATTLDGPALTRKGKARKALEMALYSSVAGDFLSDLIAIVLIGPIAMIVILVGPPEVFAIILFSLILIASVSGESAWSTREANEPASGSSWAASSIAVIQPGWSTASSLSSVMREPRATRTPSSMAPANPRVLFRATCRAAGAIVRTSSRASGAGPSNTMTISGTVGAS